MCIRGPGIGHLRDRAFEGLSVRGAERSRVKASRGFEMDGQG